jgi:hypothetical protein
MKIDCSYYGFNDGEEKKNLEGEGMPMLFRNDYLLLITHADIKVECVF